MVELEQCWNAFCIAENDPQHPDPDFAWRHVDQTGHSWEQHRGTEYCAKHHAYDTCGNALVVTIYEREES